MPIPFGCDVVMGLERVPISRVNTSVFLFFVFSQKEKENLCITSKSHQSVLRNKRTNLKKKNARTTCSTRLLSTSLQYA